MRIHELTHKRNISEAVQKIPLTDDQFDELRERLQRPIPAEVAAMILHDVLETSDLTEEYTSMAILTPNKDVRPVVAQWLELNMPDQMHRFNGQPRDTSIVHGALSPLHGYPPK